MSHTDLVVIGASAGGLDAICRLTGALPADFPAAIVVALRTSRDEPALLAEIIGHSSALPVRYADEGDAPRPGAILIAPPGRSMRLLESGVLTLEDGMSVQGVKTPIDPLFESAAAVFGAQVIGVVMTGEDHHGARGLEAIHAAGGICLVQDPADAANPDMPTHAIESDDPDYCASATRLAAKLAVLVRDGADRKQEEPEARL